MPPPYDTVISIGGQSLVDGVWRLLGPALEGLSNPLPLALPGFSNAAMRITRIIPVFPGAPPASGALDVLATVELNAEALLNVNVAAGNINISLGSQSLHLTNLTGTLGLPAQDIGLTNIAIGGNFTGPLGHADFGPGMGSLHLPVSTANLTNGDLTATLNLPGHLMLPGIPLPAVVPVAVDLTPSAPLAVSAALQLTASGINPTTRFGLLINVGEVSIGTVALDPALNANLVTHIDAAVRQLVQQLGVPSLIAQGLLNPTTLATAVHTLLAPVEHAVGLALTDALTTLLGETGRLLYPPAGMGASCDVTVLPTDGDVQLSTVPHDPMAIDHTLDNTYVLQLGFGGRPTTSTTNIPGFPPFTPRGIADSTLLVGNSFLLELLCCLVQRLPAFTLPMAAVTSTTTPATDVTGVSHVMCCNFTGATVNLGLVALNGGLSVCLDGTGSPKTITLVGRFAQSTPFPTLTLADITVDFKLPLAFDLDDVGSLANLRVLGPPAVAVSVTPSLALIVGFGSVVAGFALLGILLGLGIGVIVGVVVVAIVTLVLFAVCRMAQDLIDGAARTVLREASLVRSPVAVPPGVFEAFGKLVPVTVSVDDLTADSVLQTPTAPWALLPRVGAGRPPGKSTQTSQTHG
jgi:hypothetical protein